MLSALYSGSVFLWDFDTSTMVKSWEVCDLPVRTAKFVLRKQWFICASDDMHLRIYNYNTMEKVKTFEAHSNKKQAATKAARITRAQNREGVIDSLDLLDAERTLAETRAELADQDALVSSRQIDLFRALGGSWSAERETAS